MARSQARLSGFGLAAVAVVAAALSRPASAQGSCPSTATGGCDVTGITGPNNLEICRGTGSNIHADPAVVRTQIRQLCNTQAIDPATWVYGPEHDMTAAQQAAQLWNPAKAKMVQGLPLVGRRWSAPDGSDYCGVAKYVDSGANANHFTWADERHAALDNSTLWAMWSKNSNLTTTGATDCPGLVYDTTAARGALGSSLDEREAQHDADGGAAVFFRPVNSVRDAQEAVFWSFWPPFGHRSQGNAVGVYNAKIAQLGAGAYRDSYNTNIVMIAQISTVAGAQSASAIAAIPGIHGLFLDGEDLAFQAGSIGAYNRLARQVQAAAKSNGKYLCTVDASVTPNVMTCLPPGQL